MEPACGFGLEEGAEICELSRGSTKGATADTCTESIHAAHLKREPVTPLARVNRNDAVEGLPLAAETCEADLLEGIDWVCSRENGSGEWISKATLFLGLFTCDPEKAPCDTLSRTFTMASVVTLARATTAVLAGTCTARRVRVYS